MYPFLLLLLCKTRSLCDNNTWKLCNDVPDVVQTPCVGEVLA